MAVAVPDVARQSCHVFRKRHRRDEDSLGGSGTQITFETRVDPTDRSRSRSSPRTTISSRPRRQGLQADRAGDQAAGRASEDEHLGLLGLLNSSVGVLLDEAGVPQQGRAAASVAGVSSDERGSDFFEFDGTKLEAVPAAAATAPSNSPRRSTPLRHELAAQLPAAFVAITSLPTARDSLDARPRASRATARQMIALQEELDWQLLPPLRPRRRGSVATPTSAARARAW